MPAVQHEKVMWQNGVQMVRGHPHVAIPKSWGSTVTIAQICPLL